MNDGVAMFERAVALLDEGELREADRCAASAVSLLPDGSADVANALLLRSDIFRALGDTPSAIEAARRAITLVPDVAGASLDAHRIAVQAYLRVASGLRATGEYREAHRSGHQGLQRGERRLGSRHPDLVLVLNELGMIGKFSGRFDEAREHYERALVIARSQNDESAEATLLHNVAGLAHAAGRPRDGIAAAEQGIEIRRRIDGPDRVATLLDEGGLAALLLDDGDHAGARDLLERILPGLCASYGRDHPEVASTHHNLGAASQALGDTARAEREYRRALDIKQAVLGPSHVDLGATLVNLAHLLLADGRASEAQRHARHALEIGEPQLEPDHPVLRAARGVICEAEAQSCM